MINPWLATFKNHIYYDCMTAAAPPLWLARVEVVMQDTPPSPWPPTHLRRQTLIGAVFIHLVAYRQIAWFKMK